MTERLLTPSKITAWLDCSHYLTLRHRVEAGELEPAGSMFGSFAELLAAKGVQHEEACLENYREQGLTVFEVPQREPRERFTDWVERIGDPLSDGHDVIYQMPFVHDGVRGIADFLVRVDDPETGSSGYEPVDAKLARSEAKPGHVLQLCFYADAIEAATGHAPRELHLWLGSGMFESIRTDEVRPYWNRLRSQLSEVVNAESDDHDTAPEPCAHCEMCEFAEVCEQQWRDEDSLVFVAGLPNAGRSGLEAEGVRTLQALADHDGSTPIESLRPDRLERLVTQAQLQLQARGAPDSPPPFRVIEPTDDPTWGHGFDLMPEPDPGDMMLDFEGHPFWQPDRGLFFLFGYIVQGSDGEWDYVQRWAHDPAEEAEATAELIGLIAARQEQHPGMHVYHYNHTERSSLQQLAAEYGVGETTLDNLIETGAFVDLLTVARNAVQVGTESYGLKDLERLAGFERGDEIDRGAGAVIEYDGYMTSGDTAALDRIADYNEDDVRATLALRDWLVEQRPTDLAWRTAVLETDQLDDAAVDEQIARLHEFGPGTSEHLMADLLGYWPREGRVHKATTLARLNPELSDQLDDPEIIAGLRCVGEVERISPTTGKALKSAMGFDFPPQELLEESKWDKVMFPALDGQSGFPSVFGMERNGDGGGRLLLSWNERCQELGVYPDAVVRNDWIGPRPKDGTLSVLADELLDPTDPERFKTSFSLLRRELPRFTAGHGPTDGTFSDDLDEMLELIRHLDHSYLAVQGPPGTGKTYWGAHLARSLITAGKRVGVTAFAHKAIDNFMAEVIEVFEEHGDLDQLRAIQKPRDPKAREATESISYTGSAAACAKDEYNLVAGTTWLFANEKMRDAPVDVLIVDEAGQLSLADTLAASSSAQNILLLGDPLQLPQVSQASHPVGAGASALEHVLGDSTTMPPERGVFLTETRRMHPYVCRFISERIYDGRLTSHESCAGQGTEFGTGLRWLESDHEGCSTESPVEAEMLATEIARLIGTEWTNQDGESAELAADDMMVVAPYNNQVDLVRARLDDHPQTRGVPAGTVDKFQGQQAAVVFFTMTASSAADIPRGADFLFSRNRLNVAISRARCLAYLVCTGELLNSRARDVEEMRLISTLCAFVEDSDR